MATEPSLQSLETSNTQLHQHTMSAPDSNFLLSGPTTAATDHLPFTIPTTSQKIVLLTHGTPYAMDDEAYDGDGGYPAYIQRPLSLSSASEKLWIAMALPAKFGLPLHYLPADSNLLFGAVPQSSLCKERGLSILLRNVDVKSSMFGKPWVAECKADVMIRKIGGKKDAEEDTDLKEVLAAVSFVKVELANFLDFRDEEKEKGRDEEQVAVARKKAEKALQENATSEKFQAFFKRFEKNFPVSICRMCGVPRGWKGAKLAACVKCKVTLYCGRHCQSDHWRAHKVLCLSKEKLEAADAAAEAKYRAGLFGPVSEPLKVIEN